MMPVVFDLLVRKVSPFLDNDVTNGRPSFYSPEEKLSTTLRFLASGMYQALFMLVN
jgi:hypothetical protein